MISPTDDKHSHPKLLAVITARGGSKGLPRKNLLIAGGKPLIAWTIEAAIESRYITTVVLSSDDQEIIEAGKVLGCHAVVKRPDELAGDTASSIDVVLHAVSKFSGYDYVILLQPTSPLRTSFDIDAAFELLLSSDAPSCLSVSEVEESPYWMYRLDEAGEMSSLLTESEIPSRRQDLPPVYILNGAIYIAHVPWLLKAKSFLYQGAIAYKMPKDRSLDIDTQNDFDLFRLRVEGYNFDKSLSLISKPNQ
jgi:N-acylneuraminate cytidylyltransferase